MFKADAHAELPAIKSKAPNTYARRGVSFAMTGKVITAPTI